MSRHSPSNFNLKRKIKSDPNVIKVSILYSRISMWLVVVNA